MKCWPQGRSLPQAQTACHKVYIGVLGSQFFHCLYAVLCWSESSTSLGSRRTVLIPRSNTTDERGRIVRFSDAVWPPTSCNCACKILMTTLCSSLQQYSVSCIHTAQRCVATKQVTDNIFQIETALALNVLPFQMIAVSTSSTIALSSGFFGGYTTKALLRWSVQAKYVAVGVSCKGVPSPWWSSSPWLSTLCISLKRSSLGTVPSWTSFSPLRVPTRMTLL